MNKADVDQKWHSYRFNRFKCLLSYLCFGWIVLDGLYFRPCFFYYYFQVCQCSYGTAGWVLIDTNPRQIKEKRFVVKVKLCLRFRNHFKFFFLIALPYAIVECSIVYLSHCLWPNGNVVDDLLFLNGQQVVKGTGISIFNIPLQFWSKETDKL